MPVSHQLHHGSSAESSSWSGASWSRSLQERSDRETPMALCFSRAICPSLGLPAPPAETIGRGRGSLCASQREKRHVLCGCSADRAYPPISASEAVPCLNQHSVYWPARATRNVFGSLRLQQGTLNPPGQKSTHSRPSQTQSRCKTVPGAISAYKLVASHHGRRRSLASVG